MARIRTIKPEFFLDSHISKKPPLARLLFQGLWIHADKEGRLEEDQERLKIQILPYDKASIETLLSTLCPEFITRYEVAGKPYIQVKNFTKHQRPHPKEPKSDIPGPLSSEAVKRNGEPGKEMQEGKGMDTGYWILDKGKGREGKEHLVVGQEVQPQPARCGDFEVFWKAYPKGIRGKSGKGAAEQVWKRLPWAPGLFGEIMTSLAKHGISKQWTRDAGQFIPNPATWLYQRRWEDVPGYADKPPAREAPPPPPLQTREDLEAEAIYQRDKAAMEAMTPGEYGAIQMQALKRLAGMGRFLPKSPLALELEMMTIFRELRTQEAVRG